jgi:vacuolar iron transporter family protein
MAIHHNPDFIHHQKNSLSVSTIREIVFGMEDGLVSTMGAVTGIAAASQNHFIVLLSGLVIIAVESVSMGVGSYLSTKSEKEIDERKLHEEKHELRTYPVEEREELVGMYVDDGWPRKLAVEMAEVASKNKKLFLQEMAYRELKVFPDKMEQPLHNGLAMGIAYIVGGSIALIPYLLLTDVSRAIIYSVVVTLASLFGLGALTTKFSKRSWWKAGLEMLLLASIAAIFGYTAGQIVTQYIG